MVIVIVGRIVVIVIVVIVTVAAVVVIVKTVKLKRTPAPVILFAKSAKVGVTAEPET